MNQQVYCHLLRKTVLIGIFCFVCVYSIPHKISYFVPFFLVLERQKAVFSLNLNPNYDNFSDYIQTKKNKRTDYPDC